MKQNIIQSIIRRGLSFVLLSLLMPIGAWGQTEYGLTVGGVVVTSENAESITGDNIQGSVSFDPSTNTLTLNDATISGTTISNGCIVSGLSSLNIILKGNSTLDCSQDSCTAIRSVANAALTITKGEDECFLGFLGGRAIRDFKSVTLSGMVWDRTCAYQLATINNGGEHTGMMLYDTVSDEIGVINLLDVENLPHPSMYPSYNQETNEPTFGFEGDPSWEIRYSIDYVDESLADVTNALYDMQGDNVPLQGAATVTAWIVFGDATSDEVKGKLFELSETSLSTVYGTAETLSAPTLRPAIDPEDKITVSYLGREQSDVATIDASTGEVTILGPGPETFNVDISTDDGCTVLNIENLTFDVTVQDGYPLTINNTQVTEENRLDVLGDGGSVKFDGKNTLILNGARVSSVILGADDSWVKKGLTIYLMGDNTIGEQDGLIYQGQGANMPLTFATSDVEPGTLTLSYSDQPLAGFTPTYLNNLTDMMNPDLHQITIAVSMEPFVTKEYYEAENKGANGQGIGQDIESRNTTELKDGVIVNKILYTLPSDDDGYIDDHDYVTVNGKVVALNTPMDDGEVNDILEFIKNGLIQPGTKLGDPHTFAYYFHGMSFLLPAGCGDIVLDVNTNQSGELHVKVGNNDPVVIFGTTGFEERRVPYALTEESYVFLYSVAPVVSPSRHRAPGRKMANTTTLKSVKVSARSVAATPPPVLMPKVLTKDDVAAAKSGNHITITDTDVTDYADNAFDGQTGITYVDLSATSITGKKIDRDELPASATVFLPASNDDNLAKNIVIAGVCNDLQLNDDVDFEIPSDFTAVKASLNRNFTSDLGKNCTVCVPFALDKTQAAELGTFYTLSAHSGNTITMESVDATEANKAYMFKPVKETFSAEMVDVKKADPVPTTVSSLSFLGTYQQITGLNSTADVVYYCFMQTGPQAGKFVKITSDVIVNPFRAYMELPASESLARVLDLNFGEGGATGIGSLTPNPSSIGEGNVGVYDLQGRRVLYPKKGLYILNGKKVIIK